jgi:hypothetical protein
MNETEGKKTTIRRYLYACMHITCSTYQNGQKAEMELFEHLNSCPQTKFIGAFVT